MAKVAQLENVSTIIHDMFEDERGQLFTLWQKSDTPLLSFNHDKVAVSKENVLRGLHTDKSWKLITCLYGKIQLVVVNFDKNSNQYLDYMDIVLDSSSELKTSILVPPGYLNGHLVLSDQAIFHYKWDYDGKYPDVKDQISVNWADPKINIDWHIKNPTLSKRDISTPLL
jgi:dTDP-4-dehydrorhamnose 3,5-epimerase